MVAAPRRVTSAMVAIAETKMIGRRTAALRSTLSMWTPMAEVIRGRKRATSVPLLEEIAAVREPLPSVRTKPARVSSGPVQQAHRTSSGPEGSSDKVLHLRDTDRPGLFRAGFFR